MAGPRGKDPSKAGSKPIAATVAANKKAPGKQGPVSNVGGSSVHSLGAVLEELFSKLQGHVEKQDYARVIQVADEILKLSPTDEDAIRCKVVAEIQNELYENALKTILSTGAANVNLQAEKAYCLYRKARHEEAMAALAGCERTPSVLQLGAQILYRMGENSECIKQYEELGKVEAGISNEIKTNIVAAYVSGGLSKQVPEVMKSLQIFPRESFDLAYNVGCAMIETGELKQAEELLLMAKRLGQEMLIEDDLPEEEIERELAPINVQLAFVHQVSGGVSEAMDEYTKLLKKRPGDAPSVAIASNNLVALRGPRELFDGLKKIDKVIERRSEGEEVDFAENVKGKLSIRQKAAVIKNRFLLLLYSNKFDQARELISKLGSLLSKEDSVSLDASLLVKEKQIQKALQVLEKSNISQNSSQNSSQNLSLMWAQIAAIGGEFLQAVKALEGIEELKFEPAVVATIVELKERAGDLAGAESTLDSAISFWETRMEEDLENDDPSAWDKIVLAAAGFKQRRKQFSLAASLFKRLVNSKNLSVRAEAMNGLVCSTAEFDSDLAEKYESELPPFLGISSLDVSALEKGASIPSFSSRAKRTAESGGDGTAEVQKKKKRKKKIIYPKGYDPSNPPPPPDPERWLPRRERSSYKARRKDKRGVQIRGAQGAVIREKPGEAATSSTSTTSNGQKKGGGGGGGGGGSTSSGGVAKEKGEPILSAAKKGKGKKGRR